MWILLITWKTSFLDQLQLNFSSLTYFVHQTGNSIICPFLQGILDAQQMETLISRHGCCFCQCPPWTQRWEGAHLGWPQEEFVPGNPCWVLQQRWAASVHNCIAFPDKAALMPRESLSALTLAVSVWLSKVVSHNVPAFTAETRSFKLLSCSVWSCFAVWESVSGCTLEGSSLPLSWCKGVLQWRTRWRVNREGCPGFSWSRCPGSLSLSGSKRRRTGEVGRRNCNSPNLCFHG